MFKIDNKKADNLSLPPALCWVGGKTKLKNKIISKIPEHKKYVETFVGGGAVFFGKSLSEKNIINDKNSELINFYKKLRDTNCSALKKCKLPTNKAEFKKALERKRQNVCDTLKINKRSYGCNMRSFSPAKVPENNPKEGGIENIRENCEKYKQKLKKTKISNEDYKKSFKKHDSKETFIYMDPPYRGTFHSGYGPKEKINPKDVCQLAKGAKGKVMISYDDHPEVRKACKGLKIKKVNMTYGMKNPNIKNGREAKELLITNY